MPAVRRPQLHLASREAHPHLEDEALADALVAGEPWAPRATYTKHAPMVLRFLHRALGTRPEAEDLTQEVFLLVFSKVGGLRNRAALKSFVFSIAIRTLKWELRRQRVRRIFQLSPAGRLPELAVDALDADSRQGVRRLYAILERLSAQERTSFVLRHIEHLTLDEVAEALGVSLATVKRRLDRATRLVSQEMERDPSLAPYSSKRLGGEIDGDEDAVS
jgi:RNA polymerase sigma-70 factor, ECF subfamily